MSIIHTGRPALLLIDIQKGFDNIDYWGGQRNNPHAEENASELLQLWRRNNDPVFHTHTAGIRLDSQIPAYRKFRIEPVPGGNLSWAKGRLDSPYGLIESSWYIENGRNFRLDVTIPPGTTAEVFLPDKRCLSVDPGKRRFECQFTPLH
jgi:hypothetical protein